MRDVRAENNNHYIQCNDVCMDVGIWKKGIRNRNTSRLFVAGSRICCNIGVFNYLMTDEKRGDALRS